jgi:hypothetical protein
MNKFPARIRKLPRDTHGHPIPWFAWRDAEGQVHITTIDQQKRRWSYQFGICQICGQRLGAYKAFALGPNQVETRTTTEGPAHPGCVRYALRVCPFLSNPNWKRHDGTKSFNPGKFALWITRDYEIGVLPDGAIAIIVGEPVSVRWWTAGHQLEKSKFRVSVLDGPNPSGNANERTA